MASAQRKIPPAERREAEAVEERDVDLDRRRDDPSSRQREHSRSIGSIVRSTISSSETSALPFARPQTSAFASGSLCLLGGPFFSGFQA